MKMKRLIKLITSASAVSCIMPITLACTRDWHLYAPTIYSKGINCSTNELCATSQANMKTQINNTLVGDTYTWGEVDVTPIDYNDHVRSISQSDTQATYEADGSVHFYLSKYLQSINVVQLNGTAMPNVSSEWKFNILCDREQNTVDIYSTNQPMMPICTITINMITTWHYIQINVAGATSWSAITYFDNHDMYVYWTYFIASNGVISIDNTIIQNAWMYTCGPDYLNPVSKTPISDGYTISQPGNYMLEVLDLSGDTDYAFVNYTAGGQNPFVAYWDSARGQQLKVKCQNYDHALYTDAYLKSLQAKELSDLITIAQNWPDPLPPNNAKTVMFGILGAGIGVFILLTSALIWKLFPKYRKWHDNKKIKKVKNDNWGEVGKRRDKATLSDVSPPTPPETQSAIKSRSKPVSEVGWDEKEISEDFKPK